MVEIYGTLGPACASAEVLEQMLALGMTGVRLNLSHGTLRQAEPELEALAQAAQRAGLDGLAELFQKLHVALAALAVSCGIYSFTGTNTQADVKAIAEKNVIIETSRAKSIEHEADIDKYTRQLEDISNSREYDSIKKELENTNLLHQIDQKHITEAKEKIGAYRQAIEDLSDRITICRQDLEAKKEELEQIVGNTAGEEAQLRARREEFAARLDARTLSAYDRIRASVHNHLAVVSVYGGNACGGCFNTITPQRLVDIASGVKLVICEHCGRIIVNTDTQ